MMNRRPTRKPEGRGPFLKLRRMIAGVAASKPFLITVSALAAIVCWSALVASDGTLTRQKVFANVAVSVTGDAALKSRGYIVMDDILEEVPAVKMTVEVTQSNYNRVSGTSYNPHFDLTQITGEGENELSVTYSSQLYGPVVSCRREAHRRRCRAGRARPRFPSTSGGRRKTAQSDRQALRCKWSSR